MHNKRIKYFDIQSIPSCPLETVTVGGSRYYITPDGAKYPSVTTVLKSLNEEGIRQWRERVGHEEATRISTQASRRGTQVHQIAEDYLRNKENYLDGHMPSNIQSFLQIQKYLDLYCDIVYGNEIALYSDQLRTAGRCDLIARIHNIRTIGDFKTAKRAKKEEWITNYFYQCTAYALMLYEREKLWCPQICLMISTDEDGLQVILKQTNQFVEPVEHLFKTYKSVEL